MKTSNPQTPNEQLAASLVDGIELLIRAVYLDMKGRTPEDFLTKEALKDDLATLILDRIIR